MNAYLIDPFAKRITAVEYSGDYHHIYELIGCETFTVVNINSAGDGCFVDDEGLLRNDLSTQAFFRLETQGGPCDLCGKGLVLGVNANGDSIAPSLSLPTLWSYVTWLAHEPATRSAEVRRDTPPIVLSVPSRWIQWANRADAAFLIAVKQLVDEAGVADDNEAAVRTIMRFVAAQEQPFVNLDEEKPHGK